MEFTAKQLHVLKKALDAALKSTSEELRKSRSAKRKTELEKEVAGLKSLIERLAKGKVVVKKEKEDRIAHIFSKILSEESVTVDEMVQKFSVTDRTAREDFASLMQLRFRRSPGGMGPAGDTYYDSQRIVNLDLKHPIARAAANEIDSPTSVVVSPGTTAALAVSYLMMVPKTISFLTNSMALVDHLSPGHSINFPAGNYDRNVHAILGDSVAEFFDKKDIRQGIVGVSGIRNGTLYVRHESESNVIRRMLHAVKEKLIIVADFGKIGRGDPWPIGEIDLISREPKSIVLITNDINKIDQDDVDHGAFDNELVKLKKLRDEIYARYKNQGVALDSKDSEKGFNIKLVGPDDSITELGG